ncbi:MAG: ABC transporter permease, partial [Firmicutes bacterium]|nr:ABC transporter permease [Bacillota bacterium]
DIPPLRVAPLLSKFTGGEILVAPLRWAGQQTRDATGDIHYRFARLVASGTSWLEWFYPELYDQGFWIRHDITPSEFFDPADVEALSAFPGVTEVIVTPMLPTLVQAVGGRSVVEYPLRIAPMMPRLQKFTSNPPPADEREAAYVYLNAQMHIPQDKSSYRPDQTVQLVLPRKSAGGLEFAEAQTCELPLAGYVEIPTRLVAWHGPGENVWEAAPSLQLETGVFKANVAWVSEAAWQQLLQQMGMEEPLPVSNLVLHVDDLQQLDETLVRLSEAFPHLTFVHMNRVEERLYKTGSMEYFRRAPKEVWMRVEQSGLVVPQSFSPVFSILFLLIAGLLLGGHMLTGAAARRKEIGMLRALGARRRDILILGASETSFLTFVGVTAGYLGLRLFGMIMELRGGQKLLSVLWRMAGEYGQVLGISLVVSLIFALLPIWRLSQITPMEVLRHE